MPPRPGDRGWRDFRTLLTQRPVQMKYSWIVVGSAVVRIEADAGQRVTGPDGPVPHRIGQRNILPGLRVVRVPRLDDLLVP